MKRRFHFSFSGLITAFRTLTILPVPGEESESLSSSLIWFPLIGLLVGAVLYGIGVTWCWIPGMEWPLGGAIVLIAAEIVLTRGLHLDGLADWADAVGASRGRPERLKIMKDSRLGTFGVLALIVVLLARVIALERILSSGSILCLMPVGAVSRAMMVELMTSLPYARSGEGMARPFVEGASRAQRLFSLVFALAVCLCFGPAGIALLGMGWVMTRMMRSSFKAFFGGVTGDLLGTNKELTETILLMLCALPGDRLLSHGVWGWPS